MKYFVALDCAQKISIPNKTHYCIYLSQKYDYRRFKLKGIVTWHQVLNSIKTSFSNKLIASKTLTFSNKF